MSDALRALRARLSGPAGANLAMQVFSLVLGLVASALLGRALGPADLGVYAFAFAVASVIGVAARLGFENLVVREVAVAVERSRWGVIVGLVRFSEGLAASSSLVLGAGVLLVGAWLTDPATAAALAWVLPLLLGTSGAMLRAGSLRGLGAVVLAQTPLLLVRPVVFLGLVLLLYAGFGDTAAHAVAAQAVAFLIAWAFAVVLWARRRPAEVVAARPELHARAWMGSASSLVAIGLLTVLQNQADVLLLKGLASDAATGIYSVASQLSRTTSLVLTVVNGIVAPQFAALHVRGDRAALQHLVGRSAASVTVATIPAAAALAIAGPWVLAIFSPDFVAGYPALLVLVGAQVINSLSGSVGNLLVMTGHEREVGRVTVLTVALNVALNVALVPRFEALGAAIGAAAAMIVWNVVLAWRVRRLLGIDSTAFAWLAQRWSR